MRIADHREQRQFLRFAIDGPTGIENLVAAVFAIRLREHHQFDVARVAPERVERVDQIIDFVVGQCEAQRAVRGHQRIAPGPRDVHPLERRRRQFVEQTVSVLPIGYDRFGHAIVQRVGQRITCVRVQLLLPTEQRRFQDDREFDAALDAPHRLQTAVVRDIGGFAGPRRDSAETRHDQEGLRVTMRCLQCGIAITQQCLDDMRLRIIEGGVGMDEMQIERADINDIRVDRFQRGEQPGLAEIGKGRSAGEARELGHWAVMNAPRGSAALVRREVRDYTAHRPADGHITL